MKSKNRLIPCSVCSLATLALLTGCQFGVPGSGVSKTEIRNVDPFDSVSLAGSGGVEIQVGPVQSVLVTIDNNLMPLITTTVHNGQLKIGSQKSWSSTLGLSVKITVPALTRFSGSGAVDAKILGIDSDEFEGRISGSGSIVASGKAGRVESSISGSGDIDFSELIASNSSASISGSGTIEIHGIGEVEARISGSGEVNVYVSPVLLLLASQV